MSKISVIIKEPGRRPRHVNISPSEGNLKVIVGGKIGQVALCSDFGVIFRENQGNIPFCCDVCGQNFFGTVIFAGWCEEGLCDLPVNFKDFKGVFPHLWKEE